MNFKKRNRFVSRLGYKEVGIVPGNGFWKSELHIYDMDLKRFVDPKGNVIPTLTTKKCNALHSNAAIKGQKLDEIIQEMNDAEKVYVKGFKQLIESEFYNVQ